MITNRWVFDDAYDAQIQHRDTELDALTRALAPTLEGVPADDVLIHGPSGTGKTSAATAVVRDLRGRIPVSPCRIECAGRSAAEIVREAIHAHPTESAIGTTAATDALYETLREVVADDEPYVLILDEGDDLPDLDLLERLLAIEQLSVVVIVHDVRQWLAAADEDVTDRFPMRSQIEFRKYGEAELVDILRPRAEHGLEPGVVDDDQLGRIADQAAGTPRLAIRALLAAAESAVEANHEEIGEANVDDCVERAQADIRKANLQGLGPVYQRLYELVRREGEVGGGELREAYREGREAVFDGVGREPVSWRRARDYLGKLDDYGLIEIAGSTSARTYRAVDGDLEAPNGIGLPV
ncbi:Cdc6/Cdc18 family protein [Saliphagus sp. LR7]|uniref:Cdc6/Cdc18 family protein n=1 Tax=Saliphagus sp. LR7 TaxID=2282654 RepID=UPI000DF7BF15|nr:AAA family ATPase [Saliphagus sp. LR7]